MGINSNIKYKGLNMNLTRSIMNHIPRALPRVNPTMARPFSVAYHVKDHFEAAYAKRME